MNNAPFLQISSNELALALSIVLTACSQVLLRLGARNKMYVIYSIFNAKSFLGYAVFFIVVLLMVYAMQQIPLRTAMAWTSLTYIFTPLAAHWLAKDPLTLRMLAGAGLIVFGIVIFSL